MIRKGFNFDALPSIARRFWTASSMLTFFWNLNLINLGVKKTYLTSRKDYLGLLQVLEYFWGIFRDQENVVARVDVAYFWRCFRGAFNVLVIAWVNDHRWLRYENKIKFSLCYSLNAKLCVTMTKVSLQGRGKKIESLDVRLRSFFGGLTKRMKKHLERNLPSTGVFETNTSVKAGRERLVKAGFSSCFLALGLVVAMDGCGSTWMVKLCFVVATAKAVFCCPWLKAFSSFFDPLITYDELAIPA